MTEEHKEGTEEQPEMKMVKVAEDTKAKVTIFNKDADNEQFECSRNVVMLRKMLEEKDVPEDTDVNITLAAMDPEDDTKEVQVCLYKGACAIVKAELEARTVSPEDAVIALRRFLTEMGEMSYLKGIIVSAVFGDVGVGGFSMLNNHVDLNDEDMIMLHEAAGGQAEVFKGVMSDKGIKFPGDNESTIIVPGNAGKII